MAKIEIPSLPIPQKTPRKCWNLWIEDDAPFDQATLGGHSFSKFTEPIAGFDSKGRAVRKHVTGIIEELTDKEAEVVTLAMSRTVVRSHRRPKDNVVVRVDVFAPTEAVPMDPETDEVISKYTKMEPIERPSWWDRKE